MVEIAKGNLTSTSIARLGKKYLKNNGNDREMNWSAGERNRRKNR